MSNARLSVALACALTLPFAAQAGQPLNVVASFGGGELEASVRIQGNRDGTFTAHASYGFLARDANGIGSGGQIFRLTSPSESEASAAGLLVALGALSGRSLADVGSLLREAGLHVGIEALGGKAPRGAFDANTSARLADLFSSALESAGPDGPVSRAFQLGASALGATVSCTTGVCANGCSDHGLCIQGKCACFPGYDGVDCGHQAACPNDCSNAGVCAHGKCFCKPGHSGEDCSVTLTCPNQCSGAGVCFQGKCFCVEGRSGEDCSVITASACPNDCSGNGLCHFGKCLCEPGFTGVDCGTSLACPNECSGAGVCNRGKCFCEPGHSGEDCSEVAACPGNCNAHGICSAGKCFCFAGYYGTGCESFGETVP